MNLQTERMSWAGKPKPKAGEGFGPILRDGFYLNYLHGLDYLCRKYVNKETRILELGCFYGTSSTLFREHSNFVTCVDVILYEEMENTLKNIDIKFIKSDSIEYLKNVEYDKYDLIYIDTTHDYGRTKEEITLAYKALKNNSYIAGHDYNTNGVWSAVLDVFHYPDIEIYLDGSWLIQKNDRLILK